MLLFSQNLVHASVIVSQPSALNGRFRIRVSLGKAAGQSGGRRGSSWSDRPVPTDRESSFPPLVSVPRPPGHPSMLPWRPVAW